MKHTTPSRADGYDPNDPVYAAIAAHRAARAKLESEDAEHARLENMVLKKANSIDKRKFRAADHRWNRASDREAKELQKVATVRPKSVLGAAVLLKHVHEQMAREPGAELIHPENLLTMLDNVSKVITLDWANKLDARYV